MSARIAEDLGKLVEEAELTDPDRELPIIVTVAAGADLAALERLGLKIHLRFDSLPGAAGTLAAAKVRALAEMAEVRSIDHDSDDMTIAGPES